MAETPTAPDRLAAIRARAWYEDTEDCVGGWLKIREIMQEIARDSVLDGYEPVWDAYSNHVQQSLDQELYGEFLSEGGWDSLEPMWDAFRSGWGAGAAQYGATGDSA